MIVLGIILLIVGHLLPLPLLYTIGGILIVVGIILWILGAAGHPFAGGGPVTYRGKRYWL